MSQPNQSSLTLSAANIETLAFIASIFKPENPQSSQVQQLIDHLITHLSEDSQQAYRQATGQIQEQPIDDIADSVWVSVLEAYNTRHELQFEYIPDKGGIPREHVVQPWDLDFTMGQYRLWAYCLYQDSMRTPYYPNTYRYYQLHQIVPDSIKVLPAKLPTVRPSGRPHNVIIEFSPAIAEVGLLQCQKFITTNNIMTMDNGWVRIRGQTHHPSDLAQNLLYYGSNCRVLGGEQLLQEICTLVTGLFKLYF